MTAPIRVRVQHTYTSDPATVFEALSEHENLDRILPAKVTRLSDGETSRNGVGSSRNLKMGPLPAFVETVTKAEPDSLIEYKITKGSPLKGHYGIQRLTPTADGGTTLEWTIGFNAPVPGMAAFVGKALTKELTKALPKLVD